MLCTTFHVRRTLSILLLMHRTVYASLLFLFLTDGETEACSTSLTPVQQLLTKAGAKPWLDPIVVHAPLREDTYISPYFFPVASATGGLQTQTARK